MPTVIPAKELNWLAPAQILPLLIPATSEDVFTQDVYLSEITLTNESGTSATVTIADKQATPRAILFQVPIAPHETYEIRFEARYCPGGCTWMASAAGAICGYVRGRV